MTITNETAYKQAMEAIRQQSQAELAQAATPAECWSLVATHRERLEQCRKEYGG